MQFLQSNLIKTPHGMFNRHHGTSVSPFASLNVSFGVGDNAGHVSTNRRLIKKALNIPILLSAKQVHGNKAHCVAYVTDDNEVDGVDALITDQAGVGLLIQQADCQAILIYDPVHNVVAALHCGWRGSIANIIATTIEALQRNYLSDPSRLQVAISPSLGPCCAEFVNYRAELPEEFHCYQEKSTYFNFWDISTAQLKVAGVVPEHIDIAGICTCCNRDYFSYRRSRKSGKDVTGRNCSVISLPLD